MKVCIYGIGAVGGSVGYHLAKTGVTLSAVARGNNLEALKNHGLREAHSEASVPVHAAEDPSELGIQDLVILSVKTTGMKNVAERIAPLLGDHTAVISMTNGIPWWFFEGFGGSYSGTRLESVDPGGSCAKAISGDKVIGSVVHFNASMKEPGMPSLNSGKRIILGEPSGKPAGRTRAAADLLTRAGFEVELSDCIQKDIWFKLWGNMTMNPITAMTGVTMDRVLDDPLVKNLVCEIMNEAKKIGEKIGCPISQSVEDRNAVTRKLGAVRTSMLQDVSAGKRIELDAIVGSVREIGSIVGVPTPFTDALFGLVRLFAREKGLY
jgi:2-dehydropantoate 2-reductase